MNTLTHKAFESDARHEIAAEVTNILVIQMRNQYMFNATYDNASEKQNRPGGYQLNLCTGHRAHMSDHIACTRPHRYYQKGSHKHTTTNTNTNSIIWNTCTRGTWNINTHSHWCRGNSVLNVDIGSGLVVNDGCETSYTCSVPLLTPSQICSPYCGSVPRCVFNSPASVRLAWTCSMLQVCGHRCATLATMEEAWCGCLFFASINCLKTLVLNASAHLHVKLRMRFGQTHEMVPRWSGFADGVYIVLMWPARTIRAVGRFAECRAKDKHDHKHEFQSTVVPKEQSRESTPHNVGNAGSVYQWKCQRSSLFSTLNAHNTLDCEERRVIWFFLVDEPAMERYHQDEFPNARRLCEVFRSYLPPCTRGPRRSAVWARKTRECAVKSRLANPGDASSGNLSPASAGTLRISTVHLAERHNCSKQATSNRIPICLVYGTRCTNLTEM